MLSKINSVLLSAAAFFFTITVAFAVPILCRPLYYIQIKLLHLEEATGYTYEVIRGAFDDVMDFLVLGHPFGTGELAWSVDGKSHFEDCQFLFRLDFVVLAVSILVIAILLLLYKMKKIDFYHFRGYCPLFYTGIVTLSLIAILGIWGVTDFDSLFVAFHSTFFPGKTNWIFDYELDQIINILPEQFFFNCGALILGIILLLSILFIVRGIRQKKEID